ncbi:MAG: xanthine dehydrogenase family protein [Firmicutes bacterium]|nr:xanthine dehydrogenase family protein [Bacillota bacterium]
MLFARLVTSPYAHARIRSIRTAAAQRHRGVFGVFTAEELSVRGLLAQDEVFYAGEPVAVVLAESEAIAEDAADQVLVDYEPLPAIVDPIAAMRPDAPIVRPLNEGHEDEAAIHGADVEGGQSGERKPPNVPTLLHFCNGDVQHALAAADVVVRRTYRLASVYQGYLETRGCLAKVEQDGRLTVYSSTQGAFATRSVIAQTLQMPDHLIRVVPMTVGGAFGAKFGSFEPLAAALAQLIHRPVRIVLDRIQDFLTSTPAPAAQIELQLGARKDGRLTALSARLLFDTGAQPGAPAGIAAILLGGTYQIPNFDLIAMEVLTHKNPSGAYRGPGAPQAFFALESAVDEVARELRIDPIAFRLQHASQSGDPRPDGKPWPKIGLVDVLQAAQQDPHWRDRQAGQDEGWGVAVGGWVGGLEPAAAGCRIDPDGHVTVTVGATDLTGTATAFQAIAAETLGLSPQQVHIAFGDTEHAPYAGAAGGSKTTYTVGLAVQQAAQAARSQLLEVAAQLFEAAPEDLELRNGAVQIRGVPSKRMSIAEIAVQTMRFGGKYAPIFAYGRTAIREPSPAFGIHAVKVAVNRRTGAIRPRGYLAIQDVGKAINPAEVRGQIMGGIAQGIGRALHEALLFDEHGTLINSTLADYALPTVSDVPPITISLVEIASNVGPFGAKGVGEPPAIPGAAALANAVADAAGVRLTSVPMRPQDLLAALDLL